MTKRVSMVAVCFLWTFFIPRARSQEIGVYLSSSFDQSTGSAYAYAETWADYATGYYYEVCTDIYANIQDDSQQTPVFYGYAPSGVCGSTDAAMSWSFTVPTTTDWIGFTGLHQEVINYPVYQFDPSCGSDGYNCNDYWDAFELSLLGIDGGTHGSADSWGLYGPPAVGVAQGGFNEYTGQSQGSPCAYPNYETSTYYLQEDTSSNFFGAGFKMPLYFYGLTANGTPANFAGRQVTETITNVQITLPGDPTPPCWSPGDPFPDPRGPNQFGSPTTWTVHSGNIYGDQGQPDADFIGRDVITAVWYQNNRAAGQGCIMWSGTQSMRMWSCTVSPFPNGYSFTYDQGHTNWFTIYTNSMYGARQSVPGIAQ